MQTTKALMAAVGEHDALTASYVSQPRYGIRLLSEGKLCTAATYPVTG